MLVVHVCIGRIVVVVQTQVALCLLARHENPALDVNPLDAYHLQVEHGLRSARGIDLVDDADGAVVLALESRAWVYVAHVAKPLVSLVLEVDVAARVAVPPPCLFGRFKRR